MNKPLALVGFCGAGGIDVGLEAAGFDTIGLDWMPASQPRETWPKDDEGRPVKPSDATQYWTGAGEAHMVDLSTADAVEASIRAFKPDLAVFSPPCQAFSSATPTTRRARHPNLIASTREGMIRSGVPGWIENVETIGRHFTGFWIMLCGTHFGLLKLKRHRRFELIGWRTQQPWHDAALCMYGRHEPTTGVYGFVDAPDSERARRGVESVHEGSSSRAARLRRATVAVAVAGHGAPDAEQRARYKRRAISTISGDGGCSPGMGGDKVKRAEWRRRAVVSLNDGDNCPPGVARTSREGVAFIGKNRPGPECIRWREAMGWMNGPIDRYSLAQAIPPAYAEFLGRRFLASRVTR